MAPAAPASVDHASFDHAPLDYALFDTALGSCAIVWSDAGVAGVFLPEANDATLHRRVKQRFATARLAVPSASIAGITQRIGALMRGEHDDLADIALDLRAVPDFHRRVYEVARAIPPGRTLTYGEVAQRLGEPGAARAVGQALGRNPFTIIVPCHRVLAAGHRSGGFSAPGGVRTKFRLLEIEGALQPPDQPRLF